MAAYNLVIAVHAAENDHLLRDILRGRWGYRGFVVSDWGAVHDRVQGVNAGLHLEMPGSGDYNRKKIIAAVQTPGAPKAGGPYSQAIIANGMAYCAGQVAIDPATGGVVEGDVRAQTHRVLQNFGQQFILLLNHHYGRNGVLDVIVNASLVQYDCQTPQGCNYGGQQSFALSYHLQKHTRLYAEVFGQNNSQSNTPPVTYAFGGFYHQFSDSFGLSGGMRFGLTDHSARIGTTIGSSGL
jgi:enamine deaminase RidA (YjgF/YER057c/UK114 family)